MDTLPVLVAAPEVEDFQGRNLVLSIDGTANEFSIQNTNVVELCRILIKDETQLTYYTSGIGTFADPHNTIFGKMKERFTTALEMVTARHFERKVFAAYQWLSENYKPGDRIFLFGFSRGAYFVRVIAGMIEKVGLLHKGNNDQIPFAFKLYSRSQEEHVCVSRSDSESKPTTPEVARTPGSDSTSTISPKSTACPLLAPQSPVVNNDTLCARYKAAFCHPDVKVYFIGAWDTVSSVGLVRKACLPDTVGMSHVTHFRHALALDEWRVKFVPDYAHRCDVQSTSNESQIKEVWFRGCHADIGGANNKDAKNDRPSLRWMISEAKECGLKFREHEIPKKGDLPSTHDDPATWYWRLIEWLPIRRVTHGSGAHPCQEFTRKLHKGRSRTVRQCHQIHSSVRDAMKAEGPILDKVYVPKARLCKEGPKKEDRHEHVAIKGVEDIEQWVEDVDLHLHHSCSKDP